MSASQPRRSATPSRHGEEELDGEENGEEEQRAREARQMAEATVEEPMRTRISDVEIQARAAGRELFKDLVLEGVAGDKISSLWIAKYVSKHGLI